MPGQKHQEHGTFFSVLPLLIPIIHVKPKKNAIPYECNCIMFMFHIAVMFVLFVSRSLGPLLRYPIISHPYKSIQNPKTEALSEHSRI